MKQYSAEELSANYDRFMGMLEKIFSGKRLEKLKFMYSQDELGMELVTAPASTFEHFHSCYTGGYIDHVLNVVENAYNIKKLFMGKVDEVGFTDEELFFAAFHHDLGKLGDGKHSYYIDQDSDWHRKNQGSIFKINPELHHMDVTDRAVWLLQKYGIEFTQEEFLGIKLADGMYNEAAVPYLKTFRKEQSLKTVLPNIVHWADHMSCKQEWTQWKEFEKNKPF